MSDYDVIIIGTGAGGGTLARHLAPSGKRILLLERGDWLPREPQNWLAQDVFVENRYVSPDTWYDEKGKPFQPQIHYFVGGATKLYGAALYRFRKEDFGELHHHDGISPAWPITYEEMEPYYTQAEQIYQVHGERGVDPTEPPASAPYPFPPVSHEPRIQQIADDLAAAGYHPFHAPCGVMLDESNMPYSTCVRCANCDGFVCPLGAKSDAEVLGVRPALKHDNVTLITNAKVVKLDTNPAGTVVTNVIAERDGRTETYSADVVVVSCGAANSAKLLLLSANDKHPNGLANGSDQVGRNYMYHNSQAVLALSKEPNTTVFQKTLALNDFYFGSDDFEYPLGNIQMIGKSQAADVPRREAARDADWRRCGRSRGLPSTPLTSGSRRRTCRCLTTGSRLIATETSTLSYTPNNQEPAKRLNAKLHSMLGQLRMQDHLVPRFAYMKTDIPVAGVAHQAGTCRFGADPATSVLDTELQGARAGQPLRGRHQLLPEHQRREPGADGDGERAQSRRPPA